MKSKYLAFVGMGFELVGVMLSTIYIGGLLDQKYSTQGLIMAGLSMLGLVGWIAHIVMLTKSIDQNQKTTDE